MRSTVGGHEFRSHDGFKVVTENVTAWPRFDEAIDEPPYVVFDVVNVGSTHATCCRNTVIPPVRVITRNAASDNWDRVNVASLAEFQWEPIELAYLPARRQE